jgi:hypothetical protein
MDLDLVKLMLMSLKVCNKQKIIISEYAIKIFVIVLVDLIRGGEKVILAAIPIPDKITSQPPNFYVILVLHKEYFDWKFSKKAISKVILLHVCESTKIYEVYAN